jgi:hypothetical protein
MINLLRWCVRIGFLGALILGFLFWDGRMTSAVNVHMFLGGLVAIVLALFAAYAFVARVRVPLAIVGLVWAAATFYVGLRQGGMMPGGGHWVIEAVHLLLGIGAIGMAEALAGAVARRSVS